MYSGSGYNDWEIGDVDVIVHNGTYHLFHLIIPNHDYIAHAISEDGISWKRTKNALFVGHPGNWDDDMLWTMHICRRNDKFVMYYTGLQRKDRGAIQKIGKAESHDLITWNKCKSEFLPFESKPPHYEDIANNPRGWLSFRDPFQYYLDDDLYLLLCARSSRGPVSRRGCVGLAKLVDSGFQLQKPLIYPMVYDDVECPCIFTLKGKFYLIGSIREDIKVRYWFAPDFFGEYRSFRSDVLLPKGNYAARIVRDGSHYLIYHFFYTDRQVNSLRVLPPPKELDVDKEGRLILRSYYRWEMMALKIIRQEQIDKPGKLLNNPSSYKKIQNSSWLLECRSGYEIFYWRKPSESFIWEGRITVEGMGKFGLVTDIDLDGNGYYISFDITNGIVQIRSWGFNPHNKKENFIFNNIQTNIFKTQNPKSFYFQVIRYGNYIEVSIDSIVRLTLIDYTNAGDYLGIYSASSVISLDNLLFKTLDSPESEYASQREAVEESSLDFN